MFSISFSCKYHWLNNEAISILKEKDLEALVCAFSKIKNTSEDFSFSEWCLCAESFFRENASFLSERCIFCAEEWKNFNEKWQNYLMSFFRGDIPKQPLIAFGTFLPIYPRDLQSKAFLFPLLANKQTFISVIAHELTHFYYYALLEKRFGVDIDKNTKIWIISEMLIPFLFSHYSKNNKEQLTCSSYLFKKGVLEKYEDIFLNSLREDNPFRAFFEVIEKEDFLPSDLNLKFL